MLLLHGFTHHLHRERERHSENPLARSHNLLKLLSWTLFPLPQEFLYSSSPLCLPFASKMSQSQLQKKEKAGQGRVRVFLLIITSHYSPSWAYIERVSYTTMADKKSQFWSSHSLSHCFPNKPPIPAPHRLIHLPLHHVSQ